MLQCARERQLPAVALCVANTYGPRDWQPTPQGNLVALAAAGRMPFHFDGLGYEVVGIEDAANALVLAADYGQNGERYIVSERFMALNDICDIAADAVGARRPRLSVPFGLVYASGRMGDVACRILRRDMPINSAGIRLAHIMSPMDHRKAMRVLGWQPNPAPDSIRRAAQFFEDQRKKRAPAG